METIDVGKKLVELGFAQTSIPKSIPKESIEAQIAPSLLSAEARAKSLRNGVWLDRLPPIPFYVIYWKKISNLAIVTLALASKQMWKFMVLILKSALSGSKYLVLRPFRKPIQAT